jgi:hypothetical protein
VYETLLTLPQALIAPKPDRLLISETQLPGPSDSKKEADAAVRPKRSSRRLSDFLRGAPEAECWVMYVEQKPVV